LGQTQSWLLAARNNSNISLKHSLQCIPAGLDNRLKVTAWSPDSLPVIDQMPNAIPGNFA